MSRISILNVSLKEMSKSPIKISVEIPEELIQHVGTPNNWTAMIKSMLYAEFEKESEYRENDRLEKEAGFNLVFESFYCDKTILEQ